MGSDCLMGTGFPFRVMTCSGQSCEYDCITLWVYSVSLSCPFKMVKRVNFMLCEYDLSF